MEPVSYTHLFRKSRKKKPGKWNFHSEKPPVDSLVDALVDSRLSLIHISIPVAINRQSPYYQKLNMQLQVGDYLPYIIDTGYGQKEVALVDVYKRQA